MTGANRGTGLETAWQLDQFGHRVILTATDQAKDQAAADGLRCEGCDGWFFALEVTSASSVLRLQDFVREFGGFDMPINNAALSLAKGIGTLDVSLETWCESFETNLFGPIALCRSIVRPAHGRARLGTGGERLLERWATVDHERLRPQLQRLEGRAQRPDVSAGGCDRGIGGAGQARLPWRIAFASQGPKGIVWAATLPDGGPTGGFFHDGQPLAW